MYENEDDYDFNPNDSSKLSSLFGTSVFHNEETNNSLMYTAPKQPNVINREISPKQPSTRVMLIKVVSLWKSEENTYKPLGKHGLAIIGSSDLNIYEIIAYKHKTNTVLRAKINSKFHFQQKKDNLSSFNDFNNQNWLVKFDNNEQQLEFGELLKKFNASVVVETENDYKDDSKVSKSSVLPKPSYNDQDSDSSDSANKANILSRITKMGQQVVPKPIKVLESDLSDECDIEGIKNKKFRKVKKIEQEESLQMPLSSLSTQIVPKVHQVPQGPVYYSPAPYSDINSIIIAQHSDLKYGLNQISERLDTLGIQKKDSHTNLTSKVKVLELTTENLQSELDAYKQKYADLEDKYSQKTDENNADDKAAEIEQLKANIAELHSKLQNINIRTEHLDGVERELEKNKNMILEYRQIIETQKHSLEELDLFYQQYKNTKVETDSSISLLNEKLKHYEMLCKQYESEKEKLQKINEDLPNILTELIKKYMNGLYQSILSTLDPNDSYTVSDIQNVLARTLKETSLQLISDIKTKLENKSEII